MKCPACDCTRHTETATAGVYTCKACGGLHGQTYLGVSYGLVKPYMTRDQVPEARTRYFDFVCIGSAGITRRHGWYDTETRLIVQVG